MMDVFDPHFPEWIARNLRDAFEYGYALETAVSHDFYVVGRMVGHDTPLFWLGR
jgi:hypothetical protein